MTTYIVYNGSNSDNIASSGSTYAIARAGSSLSTLTSGTVGQDLGAEYGIINVFLDFDLTGIGTATSLTVAYYVDFTFMISTPFTLEMRVHDYGSGIVTTADWLDCDSLSSKTLLASASTSGFSDGGYNNLTNASDALDTLNAQGNYMRVVVVSANATNNIAPTGTDLLFGRDPISLGAAKLTIEASAASGDATGSPTTSNSAIVAGSIAPAVSIMPLDSSAFS